eukprot:TRINITY_DN6785_c1_g1_i1.p1 TRINITY_DN6785_c1_g1~~TRINITY_DN6785_c1_g1_i1.p1  ORF type:complete len:733 (+),score=84.47 TRINITY_DN6785_c1_g1_i1:65-2200(+)
MMPAYESAAVERGTRPVLCVLCCSAFALLLAFAACSPARCGSIPKCQAASLRRPRHYHSYAAWVLLTLLLQELAALLRTWRGSKDAMKLVERLRSRALPSALLSVCFIVLGLEQFHYSYSSDIFAHASPKISVQKFRGFDFDLEGRPVYTSMYLEWLITVPCLLCLSGCCAIGRPLRELVAPVLVTNLYIIMCWSSLLVGSLSLRWSLIGFALCLYAWVSNRMLKWVSAFNGTAPSDLPARCLRPLLTEGLILLFLVYGIVFFLAATGTITTDAESMTYTILNLGSKLAVSIAFVVLREDEYHESITDVLRKMSRANMGMVSILRGSFDLILPCRATLNGSCCLPLESSPDMRKLEEALGRPVAGVPLVDLVAGQCAKDDFNAYIRNTLRQASSERKFDGAKLSSDCFWLNAGREVAPPVAQVVHCRLLRASNGHEKDTLPASAKNGVLETIGARIHTSVVPESALSFGQDRLLVVAIQLTPGDGESDDSEPAPFSDAQRFATFQALTSSSEGEAEDDDGASSRSLLATQTQQSAPRFVGSLADLALMGIDFVVSTFSQTESVASASVLWSNPEMRSAHSTAESETLVPVVPKGDRLRKRARFTPDLDESAVGETKEHVTPNFEDESSFRHPVGDPGSSQNRVDDVDMHTTLPWPHSVVASKGNDSEEAAQPCSDLMRSPSRASIVFLASTTVAMGVVGTIFAIRARSRKF